MSGPPGRETEDAADVEMIPVGPIIDVSAEQIGLLAIRFSIERPPRFVFLLIDAGADWDQEWVH